MAPLGANPTTEGRPCRASTVTPSSRPFQGTGSALAWSVGPGPAGGSSGGVRDAAASSGALGFPPRLTPSKSESADSRSPLGAPAKHASKPPPGAVGAAERKCPFSPCSCFFISEQPLSLHHRVRLAAPRSSARGGGSDRAPRSLSEAASKPHARFTALSCRERSHQGRFLSRPELSWVRVVGDPAVVPVSRQAWQPLLAPHPARAGVLGAQLPSSPEVTVPGLPGWPCCPNHHSGNHFQME